MIADPEPDAAMPPSPSGLPPAPGELPMPDVAPAGHSGAGAGAAAAAGAAPSYSNLGRLEGPTARYILMGVELPAEITISIDFGWWSAGAIDTQSLVSTIQAATTPELPVIFVFYCVPRSLLMGYALVTSPVTPRADVRLPPVGGASRRRDGCPRAWGDAFVANMAHAEPTCGVCAEARRLRCHQRQRQQQQPQHG